MAFGGFDKGADGTPMAQINMVPLIDVMLVLLVIFIVTAPLLTHSVKIDLPKASSAPNLTRPDNIQLGLQADGAMYWNGEPVSADELAQRMKAAAAAKPQPELHLRADASVAYRHVAQLLSAAARAGLLKIGFVTTPTAQP